MDRNFRLYPSNVDDNLDTLVVVVGVSRRQPYFPTTNDLPSYFVHRNLLDFACLTTIDPTSRQFSDCLLGTVGFPEGVFANSQGAMTVEHTFWRFA